MLMRHHPTGDANLVLIEGSLSARAMENRACGHGIGHDERRALAPLRPSHRRCKRPYCGIARTRSRPSHRAESLVEG